MLIKRCFAVKDDVSLVTGVGKSVDEGFREEIGVSVGVGDSEAVGVGAPTSDVNTGSWTTGDSAVASILGVGSTGAGAALEQASAKVPISTARITVSFIGLFCNYLSIPVNHHTTAFLKLPSVLH